MEHVIIKNPSKELKLDIQDYIDNHRDENNIHIFIDGNEVNLYELGTSENMLATIRSLLKAFPDKLEWSGS